MKTLNTNSVQNLNVRNASKLSGVDEEEEEEEASLNSLTSTLEHASIILYV
jgi:hypothetical protein